jgi:hypothetical protein
MNYKNVDDNNDIKDKDDFQIEYNDDFDSEKTKSLNKFPMKTLSNEDFYLDDTSKKFSKSLNFNFHKCFAPKFKIRQSSRNPTPIIFEKQSNISNLNTQDHFITEDAISEKEQSLDNDSSYSSDFENDDQAFDFLNINSNKQIKKTKYINSNQVINSNNNSNYIISKNLLDNSIEDKKDNVNQINIIKDNKNENISTKKYEHKTINEFPLKNNINDNYVKGNMKSLRNSLFRAKIKCLKEKNKEVEYSIKERIKMNYGLDIVNSKNNCELDKCKVIKINNVDESNDNDGDVEDMRSFRQTISYNTSKLNSENKKKNEDKGITIYEVLITNKKNKH